MQPTSSKSIIQPLFHAKTWEITAPLQVLRKLHFCLGRLYSNCKLLQNVSEHLQQTQTIDLIENEGPWMWNASSSVAQGIKLIIKTLPTQRCYFLMKPTLFISF